MRKVIYAAIMAALLVACGGGLSDQRIYDLTQQCVLDNPYVPDRSSYCYAWSHRAANQTATAIAVEHP